tara:strand:+ start:497 stop:613 length:117 start_codon:yes stop_codon:yes gene_type:complete
MAVTLQSTHYWGISRGPITSPEPFTLQKLTQKKIEVLV